MPPLPPAALAALDLLEPADVVEGLLEYVARRHRLIGAGHSKLVAIFEDGRVRKAYLELGLNRTRFDASA